LAPEKVVKKTQIKVELYNIHAEEESYWHQISHARWLLHGDQNTSYSRKIANGRKKRNTVHSLDDNGVLVEGMGDLLIHATDYYKKWFGPAPSNMFNLSPNLWTDEETLNAADNADLTRPFTTEEIKKALFSMETNRAPGPDDISSEFYQHFWEVVKDDIMNLFYGFYNGTLDLQCLNYKVITLLPKMADASKIQQFRPICLL
jgi:hypothetical protein